MLLLLQGDFLALSFLNYNIDDDGGAEKRGYGIERNNASICRQCAEQVAEQG